MEPKYLTINEEKALETVKKSELMTSDETTEAVANDLGKTVDQAKGVLGSLVKKGYLYRWSKRINARRIVTIIEVSGMARDFEEKEEAKPSFKEVPKNGDKDLTHTNPEGKRTRRVVGKEKTNVMIALKKIKDGKKDGKFDPEEADKELDRLSKRMSELEEEERKVAFK